MKIAIIEDRIGRLEQFVDFDLQSYNEAKILTGKDFDALINSLNEKKTERLDEFDCIASHRSALTNEIRDTLKEYCKTNNKPLVFFSGGITSSVFKDEEFPFLHINSKNFYSSNLELFILNCRNTNTINLLLLQFGSHWKLSLLLNLRNKIAVAQNKLILKNEHPEIDISDLELIKRMRDLQISLLIKDDLMNESVKNILSANEFDLISSPELDQVKSRISHLISDMI